MMHQYAHRSEYSVGHFAVLGFKLGCEAGPGAQHPVVESPAIGGLGSGDRIAE